MNKDVAVSPDASVSAALCCPVQNHTPAAEKAVSQGQQESKFSPTKEMLYRTARLRPDIDKTWTPHGFEPGEIVAVKYWKHQYDATTGIYRPIYFIAKSPDFEKHRDDGSCSTVYDSALDSFVL